MDTSHLELGSDDLLLTLAIADAGSISAAARTLGVAQPSVSRSISMIERRVGAPLFERVARGVRPTAAGAAVLDQARLIRAATTRARSELVSTLHQGSTEVVIGVVPYISASSVALALLRFSEAPGRSRLRVVTGTRPELIGALEEGELDAVLGPLDDSLSHLSVEPLFHTRSAIVCRSRSHVAAEVSSPADLVDRDWILPPRGDLTRVSLERLFDENELPRPEPIVTCGDMPLLTYMVMHGDVLTVMPHDTALFSVNRGSLKLIPIEMPATLGTTGIARRRGTVPSAGERTFVSALRAELEQVGVGLII